VSFFDLPAHGSEFSGVETKMEFFNTIGEKRSSAPSEREEICLRRRESSDQAPHPPPAVE
jgi:hypothetical protein